MTRLTAIRSKPNRSRFIGVQLEQSP
jgi:hypothetical protein